MDSALEYFTQFTPLSDKAKSLILSTIQLASFKKGDIVTKQGQLSQFMYIIKTGLARGFYLYKELEITDSFWMELEVCGDVTVYLKGKAALKSYQMLEDSELYCVDIIKFRSLFQLSHEICSLGLRIVENYVLQSEKERKAFRISNAEEKYMSLLKTKPAIIHRVPLIYIASYLDMSPETLSRIRARLKTIRNDNLRTFPFEPKTVHSIG